MENRYALAVQEEMPVFNELYEAFNPKKLDEILLTEPLRLNPNLIKVKELPSMAKLFWNNTFYHLLNQKFVENLALEFPDSLPPVEDAVRIVNDSIGYTLRNSSLTEEARSELSYYIELSLIISKSFDEPFKLDGLQEEVLKGPHEKLRALLYLM